MMNDTSAELISVIVPVYNAELYINRCIQSILCQSYINIELIIVNDGSTDRTLEICTEFEKKDSRVIVLDQVNQGVSVARNVGLDYVHGDYFTFVDADDYLIPDALEVALKYLQDADADIVTYGWNRNVESEQVIEHVSESYAVLDNINDIIKQILEHYSGCGGGYPWNKLWKSSCFHRNGIPRFDKDLVYFEDLEWVVRMMLCINRVVVCPECLYQYSILQGSVTNSIDKEQKEISYHKALLKIVQCLEEREELKSWLKDKYFPEIVNGIIDAIKNKRNALTIFLINQWKEIKKYVLYSKGISRNIKVRCFLINILVYLHIF